MADTLTFAVPVEWSKTTAYEQNIIVFVGKRAYTSLKAVPSGVEITDTSYWAETGVPKGSAPIDAYTKAEVDERLNAKAAVGHTHVIADTMGLREALDYKATFFTRSDMDAALAKKGIATPLDYANAKMLMANAGMFFQDDQLCVNVIAMAEVISALCAQIDAIQHKA